MSENNIVSSRLDVISKQRMMVTIYASLKQFEIVLKSASVTNEYTLQLEVSTQHILDSLYEHPLQLSIFAIELITNCFSFDTSHYIHRHIDLSVPGYLNRKYWRHYLTNEIPFPAFFGKDSSLYRGTIYNCYRFISGFYFYVQIYGNADGDLKIELTKPHDGKFRLNKYDGETICCEISRDTVRAFIAKVSVLSSLVGEKYLGNLTLLHDENLIDLLTTILDTVHVNIHFERNAVNGIEEGLDEDADGRTVSIPLTMDGTENNYIQINVQKLQEKIQKIFINYNYWIANNRARDNCSSLKSDNIRILRRWVADVVESAPQWKIKTEKDVNNRQVVPVYAALSPPFIDLEKFATSTRSMLSEDNWMKVLADGSFTYSGEEHISKFHTHMDVTLRTNTDKSMIYVEMNKADVNNQVLRTIFEIEECKLMAVEDSSSHHLRNFIKKKVAVVHRVNELNALTKKSLQQVPTLNELLKKEKILSGRVDRAIAKVSAVVDLVFEKSARRSLNITQLNLDIDEANNNFFLAAPDLEDSQVAAHSFSALDAMYPTPTPQKGLVSKKRSTLRYHAFITPAERETNILVRWTDSIVKYLNEFARGSGKIIISGTEVSKRNQARTRNAQSLWNTPLWRELPYSTASIPKHSQLISNQLFYSQKVENPTGFRSPHHWHRERFQRVHHINKHSNFKVATIEKHHQGKRVKNEHLITLAGRKFLLRDLRLFDYGVSGFSLFEFESCRSYQISGIERRTTHLYRSCFSSRMESSDEHSCSSSSSSSSLSKTEDTVRNVLAANFVFKVIVSGFLNAAAASIKELSRIDFANSSLLMSNLVDQIYDSRVSVSNAMQGSATEAIQGGYDLPLLGKTMSYHHHHRQQNIEVLGIYIPQDQSLAVEVIKVNSTEWMNKCTRHLKIEDKADKIRRGMALLGLVYHVEEPFGSYASTFYGHIFFVTIIEYVLFDMRHRWW